MRVFLLFATWGCSGGGEPPPGPQCADRIVTYRDADADGWGDLDSSQNDCGQVPEGRVTQGGDCDDADPTVNPGVEEVCDGLDNDCSGTPDDGLPISTWYPDGDGDGVGIEPGVEDCAAPPGHAPVAGDCNDANAAAFPDADEICDGVDNDCDELVDDDDNTTLLSSMTEAWADADGDGYGEDLSRVLRCDPPSGFVLVAGDCDDGDPDVNPGQQEVCGGVDDDCDGDVDLDDPSVDATDIWLYSDSDGDGLGDPVTGILGCTPAADQVANDEDCDDSNATVGGPVDWVLDDDRDGYGAGAVVVTSCVGGPGLALDGGTPDCDDGASDIYPGAEEVCDDGIDQDCDSVDEPCIVEVAYEVGTAYTPFRGVHRFRGNLFTATDDGLLSRFGMYLDPAAACSLDWYVHSGPTIYGPFVVEYLGQTVAGPGYGLYESPQIDLPTTAGTVYGLGVGFTCDVGYERAADFSWVGFDAGIGTFETWYSDDSYLYPSGTFVPAFIQVGQEYAYHAQVVMWE